MGSNPTLSAATFAALKARRRAWHSAHLSLARAGRGFGVESHARCRQGGVRLSFRPSTRARRWGGPSGRGRTSCARRGRRLARVGRAARLARGRRAPSGGAARARAGVVARTSATHVGSSERSHMRVSRSRAPSEDVRPPADREARAARSPTSGRWRAPAAPRAGAGEVDALERLGRREAERGEHRAREVDGRGRARRRGGPRARRRAASGRPAASRGAARRASRSRRRARAAPRDAADVAGHDDRRVVRTPRGAQRRQQPAEGRVVRVERAVVERPGAHAVVVLEAARVLARLRERLGRAARLDHAEVALGRHRLQLVGRRVPRRVPAARVHDDEEAVRLVRRRSTPPRRRRPCVAGASSSGSCATNVSHPRSKPKAAPVVGFAVNIAVATPPWRQASSIVVGPFGRRASGSSTPCTRGGKAGEHRREVRRSRASSRRGWP